jgi:two-component system chemotaxis response regulator CheB
MTVNVLVVDDSAFFRRRIKDILEKHPQIKVIGFADNGREAIDKAVQLAPDVITMDYEMPQMNGIVAVREIMNIKPTPILMFSSLTYEGARITLDALDAGAVDYLPKSFESMASDPGASAALLQEKVLSIVRRGAPRGAAAPRPSAPAPGAPARPGMPPSAPPRPGMPGAALSGAAPGGVGAAKAGPGARGPLMSQVVEDLRRNKPRAILIGSSTGGPVALQKVLSMLPSSFPYPLLIVQHMPSTFTTAFAERLNRICQIEVREAQDGDLLRPGVAYLAPGGRQMLLDDRGLALHISDGNDKFQYKPCVDVTFGSAAKNIKGRLLGMVLTGMGSDGREGCRLLKKTNSMVWSQDEESCVVYGMPQAVESAGLSDAVLSADELGRCLKDIG